MINWRLLPSRHRCTECGGNLKSIEKISEYELEVQCIMCSRYYTLSKPMPVIEAPIYELGKCRTCGKGEEAGVLIFGFHAGECIRKFREG